MQKDVIYIDVEDDITAIIGKVKASKQKIVALVPPKRIGILQSAVNLRLLARAAGQESKQLVLISNNSAMRSLAAAAKIPVAKNLQSKPELGEIAALEVDDGEDIIDGAELPVGEHAAMAESSATIPASAAAAAASVLDDAPADATDTLTKATPPVAGQSPAKPRVKNGSKIPNFDKFRKKILIGVAALVVLIPALVWAIVFAPHATIYISAKTTDTAVADQVTLSPTTDTSASQKALKSSSQQVQKDVSITFAATGSKNVGDKATGTIVFSTNSIDALDTTIPAGTQLTSSSGSTYATDASVTITKSNHNNAPVSITATAPGASYNGATGNASGTPSGIAATFKGSTTGGTDKTVKIVTAGDVAGAQQQLTSQSTDDIKQQLKRQFGKDTLILDSTFKADTSKVAANPGVDGQSDSGNATLAGTVTYTMMGVARSEISHYLDQYFEASLQGQDSQRVYDNGAKAATLSNPASGDTVTARLTTNGKIGPKIDDNAVKKAAAGKRYGEIQSALQSIQGVRNVDVKFSPFWVSTVPDDPNRVTIQFKLDGSN